uniref:DUF4145 domain-containing protein n=1 Tax=uncultured Psychrobacter sp. TaxID=259303 RepID=UPI0025936E35|nr:DUF4145 domain-containing protein [uncultured Psychrobacter sp.]
MNRSLYKHSFTLKNSPDYMCPKCNIGLLRIQENTFKNYTTFDVNEAMKHPEFEPEWVEYIFNCIFECNNDRCDSKVLCTGHGSVGVDIEVDDYGQQYTEFDDYYRPLFFHPNLRLITIPEGTPADIERTLNKSFELFFTSPSAAANLVRISIEEILTDQGVERMKSLHRRIEKLPEKHQSVKDHLLALKWLGNAGSHSDEELSLDDTMDAYELVEYVLSKIYYSNPTDIDRLAKEINDFKGPKKKRFL